jgi:hypothetical protein
MGRHTGRRIKGKHGRVLKDTILNGAKGLTSIPQIRKNIHNNIRWRLHGMARPGAIKNAVEDIVNTGAAY